MAKSEGFNLKGSQSLETEDKVSVVPPDICAQEQGDYSISLLNFRDKTTR